MCETLILTVLMPFTLEWRKDYESGLDCLWQSIAVSSYLESRTLLDERIDYFVMCLPCDSENLDLSSI